MIHLKSIKRNKEGWNEKYAVLVSPDVPMKSDKELYAAVKKNGTATIYPFARNSFDLVEAEIIDYEKFVVVMDYKTTVKVKGGKVIKTALPKSVLQWCSFYGVPIKSGIVILFKAVTDKFKSNYNGFDYTPGTLPKAPDWDGGKLECG